MVPKLYGHVASPPARAVMMCAKAIGLEIDVIEVDIFKGEQHKPEFSKLNPLRKVPVLDDNGFVLLDSHAIMPYLIDSYAKDKLLYPNDVKKRARVNQLLHFDSGTLFPRHLRTGLSTLFGEEKVVSEENKKAVNEGYSFAEIFLQNNKFIAGDTISIADISILATISNASVLVPLDENRYSKIRAWQKTLETLPFSNINKKGLECFSTIVNAMLTK